MRCLRISQPESPVYRLLSAARTLLDTKVYAPKLQAYRCNEPERDSKRRAPKKRPQSAR